MHILYIAPEIAIPGTHGGSTHVQEVAASLVRLGHHVTLLCRRSAQTPTAKGISYVRIPVFGGGLLRNLLYLIFTSMITKFYVLFKDVDLVIERGRIFAGIGILVAHFFKIPCAYEMIEPYTEVPLYTGKLSKRSLWYTFILRWHNHVVKKSTVTLVTHDSFLRTVPKNKALFVDTGVDPKKFHPNIPCNDIVKKYDLVKGKTLLYVGSFQPWHSCEQMMRGFQGAVKKDKDLKLLMIGAGTQLTRLHHLVRALKLSKHVIFTGNIPFKDLPHYMNASDICFALFDRTYPPFAKLSYFYSPIKLHEYKAMGKPIIASNFGNLQRLVKDNVNGILVNEQQTTNITRAILALTKKPSLRRKIGKNNREDALTTYSWDTIMERVLLETIRNTYKLSSKHR